MKKEVKQKHNKVLIVGGGESLVGFDLDLIKNFDGAVVTVNSVIHHLPRADYWITVDLSTLQKGLFPMKEDCYYYAGYPKLKDYEKVEGVHYLEKIVPKSLYKLQEDKDKITGGVDSIYGALNLAYHFEAKEIIILGMDCYGFGHWYDLEQPYNACGIENWDKVWLSGIIKRYGNCTKQLENRRVKVVNGSKHSKIDCFERMTPEEAIKYFDK